MQDILEAANVVVSFEPPHRILATNVPQNGILGYCADMLCNRTMQIWHGPSTDSARLTSAIKNSAFGNTSLETDLYDCMGSCRKMLIECTPCFDLSSSLVGCTVAFRSALTDQKVLATVIRESI